jgi:hypothetical protein
LRGEALAVFSTLHAIKRKEILNAQEPEQILKILAD